jgi:excisionase family DNA binding protein
MNEQSEDVIMTVIDTAEYLHCHISTIYRLLNHKQIPAFKLGGSYRFSRKLLNEWIAEKTYTKVVLKRKK